MHTRLCIATMYAIFRACCTVYEPSVRGRTRAGSAAASVQAAPDDAAAAPAQVPVSDDESNSIIDEELAANALQEVHRHRFMEVQLHQIEQQHLKVILEFEDQKVLMNVLEQERPTCRRRDLGTLVSVSSTSSVSARKLSVHA